MTYKLNPTPNFYDCHDPQCLDSTWDHDCPVKLESNPVGDHRICGNCERVIHRDTDHTCQSEGTT